MYSTNGLNNKCISNFQKLILDYYDNFGREMDCRNTDNPYYIFISEIMLQQTQVSRINEKYHEFINAFPDFNSLANAPLSDILAVWQGLRTRYGRVSVERVLSGPGIVELYSTLASLEDQAPETTRSEEVVRLALDGKNPIAVETIEMFCAWLGEVAGDVALMYLALGGVYLAGDILLSILEVLKHSRFRNRFENKGRGTGVVAQIPTFLITNKFPVLLGCARLLNLNH